MKATELRIGNLVYQGQKYGNAPVNAYQIYNFDLCQKGLAGTADYYDEWKPIPLTEELLLKLGFSIVHKFNKHYCINDPNGFKDCYKINIFPTINEQWHIAFSDTLNGYKDYTPTTSIKFVHQLQNLIFAITNEELTLTEQ